MPDDPRRAPTEDDIFGLSVLLTVGMTIILSVLGALIYASF